MWVCARMAPWSFRVTKPCAAGLFTRNVCYALQRRLSPHFSVGGIFGNRWHLSSARSLVQRSPLCQGLRFPNLPVCLSTPSVPPVAKQIPSGTLVQRPPALVQRKSQLVVGLMEFVWPDPLLQTSTELEEDPPVTWVLSSITIILTLVVIIIIIIIVIIVIIISIVFIIVSSSEWVPAFSSSFSVPASSMPSFSLSSSVSVISVSKNMEPKNTCSSLPLELRKRKSAVPCEQKVDPTCFEIYLFVLYPSGLSAAQVAFHHWALQQCGSQRGGQ